MSDFKLVIGLGNPGRKYEDTRHNVGFKAVELLARQSGAEIETAKFHSLIAITQLCGYKLLLAKPQTFMNRSGLAAAEIKAFYKLEFEDMLVITDDMALEPGRIRLRAAGSAGGHNGLKDIIEKLGTQNFARLRIGIGKSIYPESRDYVLGCFGGEEKELVEESIQKSAQCVKGWLKNGIDKTMTEFNV